MTKKPKIHFILPAGGVKGCFQFGFMYALKKNFSHLFDCYQIDGTSVGALNGYAFITDNEDSMRDIWFSLSDRKDLFNSWNIPILNKLIVGYNALYSYGIYYSDKLKEFIYRNRDTANTKNLHRFRCTVSNLHTGDSEYIHGTDDHIEDYVLASGSPWIITSPVVIDNASYIDGGLLETYPIRDVENTEADIIVIVGYDSSHDYISNGIGGNMLEYLAHIIDIMRYQRHQDTKKSLENLKSMKNVHFVPTTVHTSNFLDFDPEIIRRGYEDGVLAAKQFVVDVLPIPEELGKFKKRTLKRSLSSDSLILKENYTNLI